MRTYIKDLSSHIDTEVSISGWVDVRRDQGKMIFLDIRDVSGKVQAVALPGSIEAKAVCEKLRPEWVIEVKAKVNKRPEKNIKEGVQNGDIELDLLSVTILNEAETPGFDISTAGYEVGEEVEKN